MCVVYIFEDQDQDQEVINETTYRVFFLTGTPPKSSKYRKVNLG